MAVGPINPPVTPPKLDATDKTKPKNGNGSTVHAVSDSAAISGGDPAAGLVSAQTGQQLSGQPTALTPGATSRILDLFA